MVAATVPIHYIDPPLSKLFKDVDLLRVDDIVHYAGDHWRHSSLSIYVRSLLRRLAKGRCTWSESNFAGQFVGAIAVLMLRRAPDRTALPQTASRRGLSREASSRQCPLQRIWRMGYQTPPALCHSWPTLCPSAPR